MCNDLCNEFIIMRLGVNTFSLSLNDLPNYTINIGFTKLMLPRKTFKKSRCFNPVLVFFSYFPVGLFYKIKAC